MGSVSDVGLETAEEDVSAFQRVCVRLLEMFKEYGYVPELRSDDTIIPTANTENFKAEFKASLM
jgi:hypothetical protein